MANMDEALACHREHFSPLEHRLRRKPFEVAAVSPLQVRGIISNHKHTCTSKETQEGLGRIFLALFHGLCKLARSSCHFEVVRRPQ